MRLLANHKTESDRTKPNEDGRYYEEDHPVVSSGSVFRGYRDCYFNKTLQDCPTLRVVCVCSTRFKKELTCDMCFMCEGAECLFIGNHFAEGKAGFKSKILRAKATTASYSEWF